MTPRVSADQLADLLGELRERNASLSFRASGRSMWPTIRDGDLVTVSPLGDREPCRGDVVAFRHPSTGRLLIHRLVSVSPAGCTAKGDNVPVPDGAIPRTDILGIVTRVERNGRVVGSPSRGGRYARLRTESWMALLEVRLGAMRLVKRLRARLLRWLREA